MRTPAHHRRVEEWLGAEGIAWERLRYPRPEAGGETAAFRFRPRTTPRGRVVAAHGACDDALFPMVAIYHTLLERGFEVFAFDLDGNGWESTTRYSPEAVRGAVGAAAREAASGEPELPLHLLGHSMGGALVLDALARGEVEAESAVLVSTPLRVSLTPRTVVEELRGFFRRGTLGQCRYYGAWGVIPAFGPVKRGTYPFRAGVRTANFDYVETFQALLDAMDLPRAAERVRAPVLLAYGERDHLAPMAQAEELARLLPRAELFRVPGGTHYSTSFAPSMVERVAGWLGART